MDISGDVQHFIAQHLPHTRRMLLFRVGHIAANTAVQDGAHARHLATSLVGHIRATRTLAERQHTMHLFAAAPNGLLFFVGQLARNLGSCLLYEYDFDRAAPGAYRPSMEIPPSA